MGGADGGGDDDRAGRRSAALNEKQSLCRVTRSDYVGIYLMRGLWCVYSAPAGIVQGTSRGIGGSSGRGASNMGKAGRCLGSLSRMARTHPVQLPGISHRRCRLLHCTHLVSSMAFASTASQWTGILRKSAKFGGGLSHAHAAHKVCVLKAQTRPSCPKLFVSGRTHSLRPKGACNCRGNIASAKVDRVYFTSLNFGVSILAAVKNS